MKKKAAGQKIFSPASGRLTLMPLAGTAFLWFTSPNDISLLQGAVAYVLMFLPWASYCRWKEAPVEELPIFPLIAFAYWLYYAVPMFWGDRNALGIWRAGRLLSEDAVTDAMLMTLVCVASLGLGIKVRIGRQVSPRRLPDIPPDPSRWAYLRLLLVIGTLTSFFESSPYIFGEGGRQMVIILQRIVPMVAFVILLRQYIRGEASQLDRALIVSFVGVRLLIGLASGWLGGFAYLILICAVVYVHERKKVPRLAIVAVIFYVLFFQVGKSAVRERYWYDKEEGSAVERIDYWIDQSVERWGGTLDGSSAESMRDLAYESLSRVSLLTQTANVIELTPSVIPYQYGRLYSYMAVTFVPRFLWPDKPSVNEANHFYQTAYGLTTEENLDKVSIGAGILTECYINFGWWGIAPMMFLLGVFFDFLQKTFLSKSSGHLFLGMGIVLLPFFFTIESQLAQYLGGLVQKILFTLLILLPVVSFKKALSRPALGESAVAGAVSGAS